ncbi:DUF397 domain-containing protein [Streptomyces sp. NPDC003077]|uniref:DUF397 domain-containing protein n=1 Tax=Streptomyces sp. NPDC003077 TaxID=3154443 RepID=UPI0033A8FDB1
MKDTCWQKSSFSSDRDDCLELGRLNGTIAVRESDDPEAVITTSTEKMRAFLSSIKTDKFDHLT